ncbi:MAG: energy-coupling factor transporter transmembrane protein EcfT [Clostridia bacterium]|nr:energy-coupling factor transporter transmembrane protein EcfT [Clostridia bacterium]
MLKDITLGQFFPGNSIIHKMDPRLKLVITVLYITALFMCHGPVPYIILGGILILAVALSKVGFRQVTRGLKPILILLVITTLFNVFYTNGGQVIFSWKFITITDYGVYNAFYMVLRIALLIIATFTLLTYTTSPIMLTDALESVLSPLKKIKVPVHELAMMMTIALRFIPTLLEETDKIMSAQKSRGADFESGGLIRRAKALIPILIPLFISAFRRAEELATAMECRCYNGGEGRTKLRVMKFAMRDYVILFVSLAVLALAIYSDYTCTFGVILP